VKWKRQRQLNIEQAGHPSVPGLFCFMGLQFLVLNYQMGS
jgi:hypothetical protein